MSVGVVVNPSSSIHLAKDLRGKTVAVNALRNSFTLAVMNWLDKNDVNPVNTGKFIELPMVAMQEAITQGRSDAGVTSEPLLSSAVAQGARVIGYPFDAYGKRSEPTAYFSNTAWVAAHHEELRRFNIALREAGRYVSAHESAVFPLTAKFTGVPLEQWQR